MAYDAFLKIEGITGESQKDKHKGEIDISSFSWGASNPHNTATGTGSGAGKVALSDFSIVKSTDKSSPTLFLNCCTGKHFDKATVMIQKATGGNSGETYLELNFSQVFITHIAWAGNSSGGDSPQETISFAYGQVKISYKPQDEKGNLGSQVMAGWDVAGNKKV
jgi:type VI secretion system secreted protein Hcp